MTLLTVISHVKISIYECDCCFVALLYLHFFDSILSTFDYRHKQVMIWRTLSIGSCGTYVLMFLAVGLSFGVRSQCRPVPGLSPVLLVSKSQPRCMSYRRVVSGFVFYCLFVCFWPFISCKLTNDIVQHQILSYVNHFT